MGDLSKELARLWKELATDEKAPFEVCDASRPSPSPTTTPA